MTAPTPPATFEESPFPATPAVSLVGKTPGDMLATVAPRTLELASFVQARTEVETYLKPQESTQAPFGAALGIKGSHGSGKTHLIRYLMSYAYQRDPRPVQIYVKLESNDIMALYSQVLAQIDYSTLLAADTMWLSRIAQDEARKTKTTAEGVVDVLRATPASVYEYLNATLLSPAAVENVQQKRAYDVALRDPDFLRALSYLPDHLLGEDAHRWFRGEELSPRVLRRLGVKSALGPDRVKMSLHFIVALFGYAGQPFLVYVDEIERLFRDTPTEIKAATVPALKSLAEAFGSNRGFLCLAGAPDAWDELPIDFYGRIRPMVVLEPVSVDDALNLLKIYLSPTATRFVPYSSENDIRPYTEAAVREMVRVGQGNIRGILRLAAKSFPPPATQSDAGAVVGPDDVARASRSLGGFFDKQSILEEVKSLLREAQLTFVERPEGLPGGADADLAIPDAATPVAVVNVSAAVFKQDESREAIEYLSSLRAFKVKVPQARIVLIVAGYASRHVLTQLASVVDHYLIYTPGIFAGLLRPVLQQIKALVQQPATLVGTAEQSDRLTEALREIERLRVQFTTELQRRQEEARTVDLQLQGFLDYQRTVEEQRISDRIARERTSLEEREQGRVRVARATRQELEREEFGRLWREWERERERQRRQRDHVRRQRAAVPAVVLLFLGLMSTYVYLRSTSYEIPALALASSLIAGVALTGLALFLVGVAGYFVLSSSTVPSLLRPLSRYFGLTGADDDSGESELLRPLRDNVVNLRYLDQLAERLARSSEGVPDRLLEHPNPQIRYVVAKALRRRPPDHPWFLERLAREPWFEVRKALLAVVVASRARPGFESLFSETVVEYALEATDADMLYAIDALVAAHRAASSISPITDWRGYRGIISSIMSRPVFVVVHAIMSEVLQTSDVDVYVRASRPQPPVEFALAACGRSSLSDSPWSRLGRLFESVESGKVRNDAVAVLSANLETLSLQLVLSLAEFFGVGDNQSLGYYEDLRLTRRYAAIYEFLIQIRLTIEELQLRVRR